MFISIKDSIVAQSHFEMCSFSILANIMISLYGENKKKANLAISSLEKKATFRVYIGGQQSAEYS